MSIFHNGSVSASSHPVPGRHARRSFVLLLARHWKTIVFLGLVGAVVLVAYSYTLPKRYQAVATVLPPERQGVGSMLSFLSNSPAYELLKGAAADNPATDLFKTVIDSRGISEEVASDPRINAHLARLTGHATGLADSTLRWMGAMLRESMLSEALRTGMFTVTVTLPTPRFPSQREVDSAREMSAYVANKYVNALDRFNRDRLMTSARNTRVFIEGEYAKRMVQLDSAYRHLQGFQETHHAIALPEQLSATVGAAAKLTGQIQQIETAISVEERELGPTSATIKTLNAELEAAKAQLQKYDDGGAGEYILALKSAPELTRQLAAYLREVKVLEQVSAYLRSELEQQRISEQRDLPSLQLLDAARPPTAPAGPGRSFYLVLGMILGLFAGTVYVLVHSFITDLRERPNAHYRLINIIRTIRLGEEAILLSPMEPQATDPSDAAELAASAPMEMGS